MARFLFTVVLFVSGSALAQSTSVHVQSSAGAIDREQAQTVLSAMAEPLNECFEASAGVLATLRVNRSGRVASVRFMESTGTESVNRCLGRVLREARFERASGRSTVYVRVRRD